MSSSKIPKRQAISLKLFINGRILKISEKIDIRMMQDLTIQVIIINYNYFIFNNILLPTHKLVSRRQWHSKQCLPNSKAIIAQS